MRINGENINEIFRALNQQIGMHGGSQIKLVVCGGTALAALGLFNRTTKDTDVLGIAEETSSGVKINKIDRFPDWLEKAALKIARDFGLPDNWLNLGPASQLLSGLPEGFVTRLIKRDYGEYLKIYFISRKDQIYFKLYASIDRNDYHIDDLFTLKPDEREMEEAAHWVLGQDVSKEFRLMLKDFLQRNGYDNIADRI